MIDAQIKLNRAVKRLWDLYRVPESASSFQRALDEYTHALADMVRKWNEDERFEDDWGPRKVDAAASLIDRRVPGP